MAAMATIMASNENMSMKANHQYQWRNGEMAKY